MRAGKLLTCTAASIAILSFDAYAQPTFEPIGINDSVQPSNKISPDDLLAVTIFDSPAMSRKVRVSASGNIQMPLLSSPVSAAGLLPDELAIRIADALRKEEILVNPSVSVAVLQYSSRPISVAGEVRRPVTFNASGKVTLLSAITRAEGLTPEAGSFVTVTTNGDGEHEMKTIRVKDLMDGRHPELNLQLTGGEEVRIPQAPRVFVIGNVHKTGSYFVQDNSDLSVLKVLALSGGPLPFTAPEAYITRTDQNSQTIQIPIDLRGMINRKKADIPMQANDLLFVKDSKGRKATVNALDRIAGFGSSTASGLVIFH